MQIFVLVALRNGPVLRNIGATINKEINGSPRE